MATTKYPAKSTRDRLLRAATFLFARKGPAGTSVDEIVRQARCNKRMVYHYFGSKERLYRAILLRAYEGFEAFEKETLQTLKETPPGEWISKIIHSYFDFLETHPRFVALLAWENLNRGRSVRHLPIQRTKNLILAAVGQHLQGGPTRPSENEIQQFFISMTALCYFTYSNRYTLKQVLGFDPAGPQSRKARLSHVIAMLTCFLEKPLDPIGF